jgi:hypothetical protein
MLRTWLVRISPDTGKPAGSTTLVPKGRIFDVIGQTIAKPLACQKADGDMTSAGGRSLCSHILRDFWGSRFAPCHLSLVS